MAAPLKWFPFYIDAWETDDRVRDLTLAEQGAYLRLLCTQWREGSVSGRAADAERRQHIPRAMARRLLRRFFVPDEGGAGRVVNIKLAELYAAQVSKSEKARQAAMLSHRGRTANAERSQEPRTRSAGQSSRRRVVDIENSLKTSALAESKGNGTATPLPVPVSV